MTHRVEIDGQFNPSSMLACMEGMKALRVQREMLSLNHQPSNYTTFCDEVDAALQTMKNIKKMYYTSLIIAVVVFFIMFAATALRFGNGRMGGPLFMAPLFVVVFIHFGVAFMTMSKIGSAFKEVDGICRKHSHTGVASYRLEDELWCFCDSAFARKRFLMIQKLDDSGVSSELTSDVEQALPNNEELVDDNKNAGKDSSLFPISCPVDDNKNVGKDSSLFNQLSSGIK